MPHSERTLMTPCAMVSFASPHLSSGALKSLARQWLPSRPNVLDQPELMSVQQGAASIFPSRDPADSVPFVAGHCCGMS
jgi:hypothetical protein